MNSTTTIVETRETLIRLSIEQHRLATNAAVEYVRNEYDADKRETEVRLEIVERLDAIVTLLSTQLNSMTDEEIAIGTCSRRPAQAGS